MTASFLLEDIPSPRFAELASTGRLVVLLPVGSLEPHGPHLPLGTDTLLSRETAKRAAGRLHDRGYEAWIAPGLPYGVTECASEFPGVVSIAGEILTPLVAEVIKGFLAQGAAHVCVINNHLEPEHDVALRNAATPIEKASYACPLIRRFAKTLSAEFKSGKCHAGQYETSLVLAANAALVDADRQKGLAPVDVSLSENLREGVTDFVEMGMTEAYAGAPAQATEEEGDDLYGHLCAMVEALVVEGCPLP